MLTDGLEPVSELVGRVHSWDTSVGVDGPGTRFVLFTAGCPLRCVYCHNPDTWAGRSGTPTTVGQGQLTVAMRRLAA